MKHARKEFDEGKLYHDRDAVYSFSGKVVENGDVEVWVTYRSDDGFCKSSGCCFEKTIRPFDDKELAQLKEAKMFDLAEEAYEKQKEEARTQAILAVKRAMFGL